MDSQDTFMAIQILQCRMKIEYLLQQTVILIVEDKVKELYGIKVQVANADDSALADNSITITAAGK
jgi:hypothetical protein